MKKYSGHRLLYPVLFTLFLVTFAIQAADNSEDTITQWAKERLLSAIEQTGARIHPKGNIKLIINQNPTHEDLPDWVRKPEGFHISVRDSRIQIVGYDAAGVIYGCLDLAGKIESEKQIPAQYEISEAPEMKLRGVCILLMKLGSYNFPITPKEFPFFYDKQLWLNYLDFLAEHRFNYIALWNGHPFDYFVELEKFPEAQHGMPEGLLKKNYEMLLWLCEQGKKRNIRFMFEFYNIHTSVYFQKAHGLPDEISTPTKFLADYTAYCIEQFVNEFPDVGLYITAGEALDLKFSDDWLNDVIFPAVKRTGKTPPIMLRAWFIDLDHAKKVVNSYPDLYIERKFNVEMIAGTEVDPANAEWAALTGNHVVNIHCNANLEPFRWNPPFYIMKCMQSAVNYGANGLHLYPRKPWRWPYGCEVGAPQLQWERDDLWFAMWARYAWNSERNPVAERKFWIAELTDRYNSEKAAEHFLNAFELYADVLPAIQRLFWLGHDNHTIVAAGAKLSQIEYARGIPFLTIETARINDYLQSLKNNQPIEGKSPFYLLNQKIREAEHALQQARLGTEAATSSVAEAERIVSDIQAINYVVHFYDQKLKAAVTRLKWGQEKDAQEYLNKFITELGQSVEIFRKLTTLTEATYKSLSDVPASTPVRLKVCPYHWSHILPIYEKELEIYKEEIQLSANPEYNVPALPGLAGIFYGDPGLMNAKKEYPVSSLEMDQSGKLDEKNWSFEWFGYIVAPIDGAVSFQVVSDRGAILKVNNEIVVEWEGMNATKSTQVVMKKGEKYPFEVIYDHAGGDEAQLIIKWSWDGQKRSSIPANKLRHSLAQKRRMERVPMLNQ